MSNERIAFARARDLTRVGDGGGVDDENITVHSIPRAQAPAWLMQKYAAGSKLDLKLWAGPGMIEHHPARSEERSEGKVCHSTVIARCTRITIKKNKTKK